MLRCLAQQPRSARTVSSRKAEGRIRPQFPATLLRMTLFVSNLRLGAATRSPTQVTFIWTRGLGDIYLSRFGAVTYLARGDSPDLEVVPTHENFIEAITHVTHVPFVEALGFVGWGTRSGLQGSVNEGPRHFTCSSLGNTAILFWNGQVAQRPWYRTYEIRRCSNQSVWLGSLSPPILINGRTWSSYPIGIGVSDDVHTRVRM